MCPMNEQPTDINAVAPTSLKHVIGQTSVKDQVGVALESAWADATKFDNSLLVGPPGCGKSAVASVIAHEMGVGETFTEVLGQSVRSAADLNALLLGAEERTVVHIDEAHELDRQLQTALYLAIDKRRLMTGGGRQTGRVQSMPIADFTLLLSTTDEYCLLQPLRDRMRLVLRFEFYGEDELVEVLRVRARALQWEVGDDVLPAIAQRAKGTPRLALKLMQAARRVCRAEGGNVISNDHLERACVLEQIDALGLDITQQQYLRLLIDGPRRLNVLASVLSLPPRTISHVVEPFLMRAGLIMRDDQSRRQLTPDGRAHIAETSQKSV